MGLVLAFICVVLDNKFHTVTEVEQMTGLPLLAAIAEIPKTILSMSENTGSGKIPKHEAEWDRNLVFRDGLSTTTYAEMFRVLRASITLLGPEAERRITLFTSALPGEGKSNCSANFALAAAGQMKRVLLIDMDLRKPSLHKVFGLSTVTNEIGVTGLLSGGGILDDAVFQNPGIPNLHHLFTGARPPSPGELLNGARLAGLLEEARTKYDVIVIDTPPLLAVPDARILAAYADNVCLIVRANYVPKGAVHRAIALLDSGRTPVSGIVLNGFKERRRLMGANYSYGYYNYGHRGFASRYGYGSYGAYAEK